MARVLIIDDDRRFADSLASFLDASGHEVEVARSLVSARDAIRERPPSCVLLDIMLPDGSGLELLNHPDLANTHVVLMTGQHGITSFIEHIQGPNLDYLRKPADPDAVLSLIEAELAMHEASATLHYGVMAGESRPMQVVYEQIVNVAPTDSIVLVQGESGTGKELVAEAIHRESGRAGAMVRVNCGSLSKDLVASELFGHERGSFTGANRRHAGFAERANKGTLFLDEITEMPLEMQTHLLRVVETGRILPVGAEREVSVDFRLIAATNRDPLQCVAEGRLREDLYYRLSVFPIELPPLRARGDDVRLLAQRFLDMLNLRYGTRRYFSDEALAQLARHGWPGNVRDLKNTIHRMYLLDDADEIGPAEKLDAPTRAAGSGLTVGRSVRDIEKELILETLAHFNGDREAAAETLGVSAKTIYNRLKTYEREDRSGAGS